MRVAHWHLPLANRTPCLSLRGHQDPSTAVVVGGGADALATVDGAEDANVAVPAYHGVIRADSLLWVPTAGVAATRCRHSAMDWHL